MNLKIKLLFKNKILIDLNRNKWKSNLAHWWSIKSDLTLEFHGTDKEFLWRKAE